MEIKNKAQLLEFIRKQSLILFEENQAFANLEDKVEVVDENYINVFQKKLDKLNSDEERAMGSEDYAELQNIKEEKVKVLKRLIDAYKVKTKYLEQIHDSLHQELSDLGVKGSGVFRNKQLTEFNNEDFQKNQSVKFKTISSELTLQKISDNNQYKVLNSTTPSILPGDVLVVPNTKVGNGVKVTVYRQVNKDEERYHEIGTPTLQNIQSITKNPS